MKTYTVKQVSDMLKMAKDTVIYYDRLGIVSPQRGENGYRYYTNQDISELKYVEVSKRNNFALKEIKQSLEHQRNPTKEGFLWHRAYLKKKKEQLRARQQEIQAMIDLLQNTDELMGQKMHSGGHDTDILADLIDKTFDAIRRDENEE